MSHPPALLPVAPHLRLLTLNMAHGRRQARHQALLRRSTLAANLHLIAAVLRREAPDVVALQEADGPSAWSGRIDHITTLSRLAGFEHTFRGDHQRVNLSGLGLDLVYGTAILSRLPLVDLHSHAFRETWRDSKGFVAGAVALPDSAGQEIDVVSLHLDFLRPAVRRRQVGQLIDLIRHRERPLAVLGDFNHEWGRKRAALAMLARELGLQACPTDLVAPTYPSRRPVLSLDWILISEELEFLTYRTLADHVSDHLGIVADVGLRDRSRPLRSEFASPLEPSVN